MTRPHTRSMIRPLFLLMSCLGTGMLNGVKAFHVSTNSRPPLHQYTLFDHCTLQPENRLTSRKFHLHFSRRGDDDDDEKLNDPILSRLVTRLGDLLTQPTPILTVHPPLRIIFPASVAITSLFIPWPQAIVSIALFVALITVSRSIGAVDDETLEEDDTRDDNSLVILDVFLSALSVAAGSLLTPTDPSTSTAGSVFPIEAPVVVSLLVLLGATLILSQGLEGIERYEQDSAEDRRLNQWDRRFFKDYDNNQQEEQESAKNRKTKD